MFPTARGLFLFLSLVVGLPLAIAVGLPWLAWSLRAGRPLELSALVLVQAAVAAGLLVASSARARLLGLATAGLFLSTLVTLGVSLGEVPLGVTLAAGVLLVAGSVAQLRARRSARRMAKAEHLEQERLTALVDHCRAEFGSSVEPREPLPPQWQRTWSTTFDGAETRLTGPFAAELTLSCTLGMPTVIVTLDGAASELTERLHALSQLPPLVEGAWLATARARLEAGELQLSAAVAEAAKPRCFFSVSLARAR